jgi:Protein of unknown function (DUF2510)
VDGRDDQPQGGPPEEGNRLPAAGWYADPAGGGGQRWWDGERWTGRVIVAPPASRPRWTWSLSNVFRVELGLAGLAMYVSFFSIFALDACGASDRCTRLVETAWVWLLGGQAVVGAICWAAFRRSKRIAVKLAAAVVLPIGVVVVWVVGNRMLDQATSLVGGQ